MLTRLLEHTPSRFLVSGLFNTGVTYALFLVLIALGLNFNAALVLVYLVGLVVGFLLNRFWTFREISNGLPFMRYLLSVCLTYLVNAGLLNVFMSLELAPIALAQLMAMSLVMIFSFVLQRFWVFTNRRSDRYND